MLFQAARQNPSSVTVHQPTPSAAPKTSATPARLPSMGSVEVVASGKPPRPPTTAGDKKHFLHESSSKTPSIARRPVRQPSPATALEPPLSADEYLASLDGLQTVRPDRFARVFPAIREKVAGICRELDPSALANQLKTALDFRTMSELTGPAWNQMRTVRAMLIEELCKAGAPVDAEQLELWQLNVQHRALSSAFANPTAPGASGLADLQSRLEYARRPREAAAGSLASTTELQVRAESFKHIYAQMSDPQLAQMLPTLDDLLETPPDQQIWRANLMVEEFRIQAARRARDTLPARLAEVSAPSAVLDCPQNEWQAASRLQQASMCAILTHLTTAERAAAFDAACDPELLVPAALNLPELAPSAEADRQHMLRRLCMQRLICLFNQMSSPELLRARDRLEGLEMVQGATDMKSAQAQDERSLSRVEKAALEDFINIYRVALTHSEARRGAVAELVRDTKSGREKLDLSASRQGRA